MKKKKFLELLGKRFNDFSCNEKQKILDKYNNKIEQKMRHMSEKEAVDGFNIDRIVKKELFVFKIKLFLKKVFSKFFKFFKLIYLKILNFVKAFTKRKIICNKNKKEVHKDFVQVDKVKLSSRDNVWVKFIVVVSYIFLIVILFLLGIFFFINIIAFLDGVKIFGFISTAFLFILCNLLFLFILNCILHNIKIDFKNFHAYFIILVLLLSCSIGYLMYEFYELDEIDDFSEVYVMSSDSSLFDLLENDILNIQFNSNYDNKYRIKYDDSLNNQVKIVVNYYRNYYDYIVKKNRGDIYISFHVNNRNVLSTLIEGFRENKIYNLNELKRYDITIYLNEKDKDKINVY